MKMYKLNCNKWLLGALALAGVASIATIATIQKLVAMPACIADAHSCILKDRRVLGWPEACNLAPTCARCTHCQRLYESEGVFL